MSSQKKISSKTSSKNENLFTGFNAQINKSKKCNIKNKIGIITPKYVDSFSYISSNISNTEVKNKNETNQITPAKNVIKIVVYSRTKKNRDDSTTSNPFESPNSIPDKENIEPNTYHFKATQEYYREINPDYIESIIPCKPMLTSTSSKAYMVEYSKSKKYQEDKLNFLSTADTVSEDPISNPYQNKLRFPSSENQSPILEDKEECKCDDMELEELLEFQESNLPVPLQKKDDENFKILSMKKMKRKTMPPNKSVRKFAEDIEPLYEKEFRIQNNFCNLMRRKVVHSLKRIYSSNFVLKKNRKDYHFMVFRDKDIGIYEYWQAHIHEAQNDEDFDTDEEQKKLAKCFTLGEIKEAFVYVKNTNFEDCFVNFNRYQNYRNDKENEYIKEEMLKLKNNMKL